MIIQDVGLDLAVRVELAGGAERSNAYAVLTSGFDIPPEWFGVIILEAFEQDVVDVVPSGASQSRLALFLNGSVR